MTGIKATPLSVAGKKGFSLISDEKFRQLYAALLQCRMLDQRLQTAVHWKSHYDLWAGREAASAAVSACLRSGDTITPMPRALLAAYLRCKSLATARAASTSTAQLATAHEAALRHKLKMSGNIAVVFARTTNSASMRDGFALAAKQSLPVLYVLEGGTPPADSAAGIPVIRVDASDTVAIYRVAFESITRARNGGGPTILECAPWPGDPNPPDPLLKLEQYLAGRKLFRPHWKRQLEKKYASAIDEAIISLNRLIPVS